MQAIQATYKCSSTSGQAYILVRAGDQPRPKRMAYDYSKDVSDNLADAICKYAVSLGWNTGNVRVLCASLQSGTCVGVLFKGTVSGQYCPKNLDDYTAK